MIEKLKSSISGIDSVISLLAEAGYKRDSSCRNQLECVRSILTDLLKEQANNRRV